MSTNHTEHLGLCQWEAEDAVLRADFNADNQKLDAALQALRTAPGCVTGSYTGGTDSASVTVELGFRPSFLVVIADRSHLLSGRNGNEQTVLLAMPGCYACIAYDSDTEVSPTDVMTDTGFTLTASSSDSYGMNAAGIPYYYAAFY